MAIAPGEGVPIVIILSSNFDRIIYFAFIALHFLGNYKFKVAFCNQIFKQDTREKSAQKKGTSTVPFSFHLQLPT